MDELWWSFWCGGGQGPKGAGRVRGYPRPELAVKYHHGEDEDEHYQESPSRALNTWLCLRCNIVSIVDVYVR